LAATEANGSGLVVVAPGCPLIAPPRTPGSLWANAVPGTTNSAATNVKTHTSLTVFIKILPDVPLSTFRDPRVPWAGYRWHKDPHKSQMKNEIIHCDAPEKPKGSSIRI
jgi:ABC-type antimicrobial peptide transport system ATPase subunit